MLKNYSISIKNSLPLSKKECFYFDTFKRSFFNNKKVILPIVNQFSTRNGLTNKDIYKFQKSIFEGNHNQSCNNQFQNTIKYLQQSNLRELYELCQNLITIGTQKIIDFDFSEEDFKNQLEILLRDPFAFNKQAKLITEILYQIRQFQTLHPNPSILQSIYKCIEADLRKLNGSEIAKLLAILSYTEPRVSSYLKNKLKLKILQSTSMKQYYYRALIKNLFKISLADIRNFQQIIPKLMQSFIQFTADSQSISWARDYAFTSKDVVLLAEAACAEIESGQQIDQPFIEYLIDKSHYVIFSQEDQNEILDSQYYIKLLKNDSLKLPNKQKLFEIIQLISMRYYQSLNQEMELEEISQIAGRCAIQANFEEFQKTNYLILTGIKEIMNSEQFFERIEADSSRNGLLLIEVFLSYSKSGNINLLLSYIETINKNYTQTILQTLYQNPNILKQMIRNIIVAQSLRAQNDHFLVSKIDLSKTIDSWKGINYLEYIELMVKLYQEQEDKSYNKFIKENKAMFDLIVYETVKVLDDLMSLDDINCEFLVKIFGIYKEFSKVINFDSKYGDFNNLIIFGLKYFSVNYKTMPAEEFESIVYSLIEAKLMFKKQLAGYAGFKESIVLQIEDYVNEYFKEFSKEFQVEIRNYIQAPKSQAEEKFEKVKDYWKMEG